MTSAERAATGLCMHVWFRFSRAIAARRVLVALLAALFLLAPVVDSAVCAGDLPSAAGEVSVSGCDGSVQQIMAFHDGMCLHGHVHELAPMPETVLARGADVARRGIGIPVPFVKVHDPVLPEKPPRA